jgi:hypothetical protein
VLCSFSCQLQIDSKSIVLQSSFDARAAGLLIWP